MKSFAFAVLCAFFVYQGCSVSGKATVVRSSAGVHSADAVDVSVTNKAIDVNVNVTGVSECYHNESACEDQCKGFTVACYKFTACNDQTEDLYACTVSPGVIWGIVGGAVVLFILIGLCILLICCCCPACLLAQCLANRR